jgi:hypothetical protein
MSGIQESQKSTSAPSATAPTGTGIVKEIPLTQGKVAIVDAKNYEWLSKCKWYAIKHRDTFYAATAIRLNNKHTNISMHRRILGLTRGDGGIIDHKDRNGLHNWEDNLRIVGGSLNQYNRKVMVNNKSGYRGVCWHKHNKKWRASIGINGVVVELGCFPLIASAAIAYDRAAVELYGADAILNFPEKRGEYETTTR